MAYSAPTDEQIRLDIQQQMQEECRQRELDDALRPPTDITPPATAIPQTPTDNGNCVKGNLKSSRAFGRLEGVNKSVEGVTGRARRSVAHIA